jgi:thioredoxin-like negative regulator of GroEL
MVALTIDAAAVAIVTFALYGSWKRQSLAVFACVVTIFLLPVLHIAPVTFDESLYHERYVMMPLALAVATLPIFLVEVFPQRSPLFPTLATVVAIGWLAVAAINVRVTVPLWSNQLALWQWVLRSNPESTTAKENLLATYIKRGDRTNARPLADALMTQEAPCPDCMLNIAYLAMTEHDLERASAALQKIKEASLFSKPKLLHSFIVANGVLLELKNDLAGAEAAYRDAVAIDPLEPIAQMDLAVVLLRRGKVDEAHRVADFALSLFAPDSRETQRHMFDQALRSTSNASPQ